MKDEKLLREYIRKIIIQQLHEAVPIAIAARVGLQMVGRQLAKQAVKQKAKNIIKKKVKGQVKKKIKGKVKDFVKEKLKNQRRELDTSLSKSSQMSSLQNRENETRKKIAGLKN